MAKLDLRKTLRSIASQVQDDNLERLLRGLKVNGGSIAPRLLEAAATKGRAARIRLNGVRVSLRDLVGAVGVKSGAMLRDVVRRGNIRMGRASFKIVPSREVLRRWFAFQAGTDHQVSRPTSGVSAERMEESKAEVAAESRRQFVKSANSRQRG